MQLSVWCETDKGLKRESNQDAYLIDQELGLYIVADGMGGHRGGEVASYMAVNSVHEMISKADLKVDPHSLLEEAYRDASRAIFETALTNQRMLAGMGTTMVLLYSLNGVFYFANVGDSRAYLFRDDRLWQITEDHSMLNAQIRAGLLDESKVDEFLEKNVITKSVGYERDVVCDVLERVPEPGELYLLCSDGLSSFVSHDRMVELIANTPRHDLARQCVMEANNMGGNDNVTVMVVGVADSGEK